MVKCVSESCDYYKQCGECSSACVERGIKKVVTNFDHIKAMSVDELAVFIRQIRTDSFGQTIIDEKCLFTSNDVCEWLEREVDTE